MSFAARRTWLLAIVAFIAALAGVLIGRSISDHQAEHSSALHQLLHEELNLDEQQHARIESLEQLFAVKKRALELELRADNARLATAIETEHGYGPLVTAEIDRSHRAMGELQKETLSHIFAMRAVLRPDQTGKFDRAVVRALTTDTK